LAEAIETVNALIYFQETQTEPKPPAESKKAKPASTEPKMDLNTYVESIVPGHPLAVGHKPGHLPPDTQVCAHIPGKEAPILCIVKSHQGDKVEIEDVVADEDDGTRKYVLTLEEADFLDGFFFQRATLFQSFSVAESRNFQLVPKSWHCIKERRVFTQPESPTYLQKTSNTPTVTFWSLKMSMGHTLQICKCTFPKSTFSNSNRCRDFPACLLLLLVYSCEYTDVSLPHPPVLAHSRLHTLTLLVLANSHSWHLICTFHHAERIGRAVANDGRGRIVRRRPSPLFV